MANVHLVRINLIRNVTVVWEAFLVKHPLRYFSNSLFRRPSRSKMVRSAAGALFIQQKWKVP